MSFKVDSYNVDSGWKVGEFLVEAENEAAAIAEAAKRLGVEGLTQFRHVVADVGNVAVKADDAVQPVADNVEAEAPVIEKAVPALDPEVEAAKKIAETLKGELSPTGLEKLLSRLNSALGG